MSIQQRQPIIIDWGTSNFRAYRFASDGAIEERRAEAGILKVPDGDFESALRRVITDWLSPDADVLLSGMITSRNGWVETPYVFTPASLADLAGGVVERRLHDGVALKFLPGVAQGAPNPDVMRGEEIQVFGAIAAGDDALVVLPGTHSKWVTIEKGAITAFQSMMTGEVYAVLTQHSILGRLIGTEAAPPNRKGFARGVSLSLATSGLLHNIFTARSAVLLDLLERGEIAEYLSGLLIGDEIREGLRLAAPGRNIVIIGEDELVSRYEAAFALAGAKSARGDSRATIAGFRKLAEIGR